MRFRFRHHDHHVIFDGATVEASVNAEVRAAQFNEILDAVAPDGFFPYPYVVGALNRRRGVDDGSEAAVIEGFGYDPGGSRVCEIILSMPDFDGLRFRAGLPWMLMAPTSMGRSADEAFWAWHPGFYSHVVCDDLRCTSNLGDAAKAAADNGPPTLEIEQLVDAARMAIRNAVLDRLMTPRRNFAASDWYAYPGEAQGAQTWDEFHAALGTTVNNWAPSQRP